MCKVSGNIYLNIHFIQSFIPTNKSSIISSRFRQLRAGEDRNKDVNCQKEHAVNFNAKKCG